MQLINNKNIPEHIGIVIDGNREWAEERNLAPADGFLKGFNKIWVAASWFFALGVKIVSVRVFSVEDWEKSREEVNLLLKIFKENLEKISANPEIIKYKVVFSGLTTELPGDLPDLCEDLILATKNNQGGTLHFGLNYGGRQEIVSAVKKMVANGIEPEQIHEGMIRKYFDHSELGDVDVIIKCGGEQTLFGFLLWQSAYSRIVFLQKYWPDFEESDAVALIKN